MQFVMSVSVVSMVSWCGVVVFLGAMYMFYFCVVPVDGLWRLDVCECCV